MASPDDAIVPRLVSDYYFVDERNNPISFAVLPVCPREAERSHVAERQVFLCGTADDGPEEVYKHVTCWRLRLQDKLPQVWVLSEEGNWIKLQKPRSSYKNRFRTFMVTLHWLHFLKRMPEVSEKALWHHLREVFSSCEVRPSKDDLTDHVSLIKLFADRDDTLANSEVLSMFLKEKLRKRSTVCLVAETESFGKKPSVDYVKDVAKGRIKKLGKRSPFCGVAETESDEREPSIGGVKNVAEGTKLKLGKRSTFCEVSETESVERKPSIGCDKYVIDDVKDGDGDEVCAICDNGGEIICCDGLCWRSFHASKGAGRKVRCESLGYTNAEVKAMQKFFCKNCKYKQHQCFACGKLGSSDQTAEAEVFPCAFAYCGHFYHPKCVAELLFQKDDENARNFQNRVAAGESFTCPYHKCIVCKKGEDKKIPQLQFAICRRCPRAYHRQCLPREISFEDIGQGIVQRAWKGLLPNRILIYCMKHDIDENLQAPLRNHIIFPKIPKGINKCCTPPKILEKNDRKKPLRKRKLPEDLYKEHSSGDSSKIPEGKNKCCTPPKIPEKNKRKKPLGKEKLPAKEHVSVEPSNLIEKPPQAADTALQPEKIETKKSHRFAKKAKVAKESKPSDYHSLPLNDQTADSGPEVSPTVGGEELGDSFPEIDNESMDRIKFLMYEISSLSRTEDVNEKNRVEMTHDFAVKHTDVSIKNGKVKGSFEAVLTTLHKRRGGKPKKQKLIVSIAYSTDERVAG